MIERGFQREVLATERKKEVIQRSAKKISIVCKKWDSWFTLDLERVTSEKVKVSIGGNHIKTFTLSKNDRTIWPFKRALGWHLNHVVWTRQSQKRPKLWPEVDIVWRKLYRDYDESFSVDEEVENADNSVRVEKVWVKKQRITYKDRQINFSIQEAWSIHIAYSGSEHTVSYRNQDDFTNQLTSHLNACFGDGRVGMLREAQRVFDDLTSAESSEFSEVEALQHSVLNLPLGQYTINSQQPETYLLVKNQNSGNYYCLSFVQSAYGLLYGEWASQTKGLFSAEYAESISINGEEWFNEEEHTALTLPVGTVLRLSSTNDPFHCTSIGIYLWDGKVWHLIGDTLHIEKFGPRLYDGWNIMWIAKPQQENRVSDYSVHRTVASGSNLERIAYLFKNELNISHNLHLVRETIYQLNKEKFVKKSWYGDTTMETKEECSIVVPSSWK